MQGFLAGSTGNQCLAAELFGNALEVIDWGRKTWKDVPRDDRGAVFDVLFRRSVNRLFITAVMDVRPQDSSFRMLKHHPRIVVGNG